MIAHGSHIIIMALLLALQGSSGQRVDVLAAAKPNAVSRGDGSMVREHQGNVVGKVEASANNDWITTILADSTLATDGRQLVSALDDICQSGIMSDDKDVCCSSMCGTCGGPGCGSRPGGAEGCCRDPILESEVICSQPGDIRCIVPQICQDGIISGDGDYCCDKSCGTCGKSGCSSRPGGAAGCCGGPIIEFGVVCSQPEDTACIMPGVCRVGVMHNDVCCDESCGTCGGIGCSLRPGGAAGCCGGPIKESGVVCADELDTRCIVNPSEPEPPSPVDDRVTDEMEVNSAKLLEDIEPAIKNILLAIDNDPLNEALLDELRETSVLAWSSESGLLLAETLDASDEPDPTYVQLRETAASALSMLCKQVEAAPSSGFSQATKDCACGRTNTPFTYCAAKADLEVREFINAVPTMKWGGRSRQLGMCKVDTPGDGGDEKPLTLADVNDIFKKITEGTGSICLKAECEVPFPPPASFIGLKLEAGGCLPGLDFTTMTICEDGPLSCSSIQDLLAEAEKLGVKAAVDSMTDPKVYVSGEICLLAVDDVPIIGDFVLPLMEKLGIPACFVELKLTFFPLMGYLVFEASVKLFGLQISFTAEMQFYDEVREATRVCDLLEDDQCNGQSENDQGQNSCSLCRDSGRGEFKGEIVFWGLPELTKELFNLPFGDSLDGQCQNGASDGRIPAAVAQSYTELWSNVGYRGTGTLPDSSHITSNNTCIITASEIQAAPFNVIPDDGNDDSAGIQAAIDYIGSQCSGSYTELSLIELPPGTINTSTEIHLDVDFLIVRGQGNDPDKSSSTKIEFLPGPDTVYDGIKEDFDLDVMKDAGTANGGWIWPGRGAFRIQSRAVHRSYDENYKDAPANRKDFYEGSVNFHWKTGIKLAEDSMIGDNVLVLDSSSSIMVGDYVWVGATNSHNMYNRQGVKKGDRIRGYMRQQIFIVSAVNGKAITIDKPLEFDMYTNTVADGSSQICGKGSTDQSKVIPLTMVRGVGLENFFLTQIVPGHSASEATYNYNNIVKEQAMHGIVFKWAADSYVKDVRTYMTGSHPIVTEFAKNLQFQDNVLEGSWNKGKGGNGYFRNSKIWDSLIQDTTTIGLRHLTLQWSASGNVVRGNTVDSDINMHGGWERHNLIEQNIVRVPYDHRDCSPNCSEGEGTWYPIWWGAGEHAGGWSGATGPRNVLFNNVLTKQLTPGGPYIDYAPYGTNPYTIYQLGWESDTAAGSQWKHMSINGVDIDTWTYKETAGYETSPNAGVNSNCEFSGSSLVDATVEECSRF